MTPPYGPVLCTCGQPATRRSIRRGKRLCLDCGQTAAREAALQLHAHSGPVYDAWKAAGGASHLTQWRARPESAPVRQANLWKMQAGYRRWQDARTSQGAAPVPPEPAPVPPPQPVRAAPQALFYYGR